ncbi:hypothetical protein H0H92_001509 [Tricholoma furcatifolium]|nr:hypothetical protein H0H92_001509 [Tricholoma furcatifolium]
MGFCRRCGDIVSGVRCKCGGTAVAPTVNWNQANESDATHDSWSKTYVQRARSVSPTRPQSPHLTGTANSTTQTTPTKRFPRPLSQSFSSANLDNRVSAHIASSTNRPPSPLKYSTHAPAPEVGILPSLNDTTLSKVYGSVLQPKESLATHSCDICSSPFPPDATIYPDPNSPDSTRFLCRPCYETNGGTKGICPTCSRPVLTLKSEGQFIHAANQFWHKRCFTCSACLKYIGDKPMVDLFGRPSCADCFESCLKRDPSTPKKRSSLSAKDSPRRQTPSNIGGISSVSRAEDIRSRDGSPALEELQQRLGIAGKREGSPALEDLSQRLAGIAKSTLTSPDGSPSARRSARRDSLLHQSTAILDPLADDDSKPPQHVNAEPGLGSLFTPEKTRSFPDRSSGSPAPAIELIEQMKQRFLKSPSPSPKAAPPAVRNSPNLRHSRSSNSLYSSPKGNVPKYDDKQASSPISPLPPFTPDLISDFSDATTQSSIGLDSPPRLDELDVSDTSVIKDDHISPHPARDLFNTSQDVIAEETTTQMGSSARTPTSIRNRATPPSRLPKPISRASPPKLNKSPDVDLPSQPPLDTSGTCAECGCSLYSIRGGGKFVTVPGEGLDASSMTYHVECFRCAVCDRSFREGQAGQAAFVKANGGACHVECAPSAKIKIHKISSVVYPSIESPPVRPVGKGPAHSKPTSSSRLERPLTSAPSPSPAVFSRFGSRATCPGCSQWVSPMEQGVVPGPQNTRWHASCLVCGGKKSTPKGIVVWGGREEKKTGPGCGKRLDSAARTGIDGAVWCRECLLLVGVGGSPQTSPTRAPLSPTLTEATKLASQTTGTTTIARQFTGIGGGCEAGLLRQLTGGGLSPTRSISPTKQVGNGMRPRPKSVIGMRSAKSLDEGRGMFLVRQMTGTG